MSLTRSLGASDERAFLAALKRRFGKMAPPAPRGIGDDAAVLEAAGNLVLASTDCLIENRHFRRGEPPFLLGRKCLAVNLSDIAAMGGRPAGFLLTLGLPGDLPGRYLGRFLDGLRSASAEWNAPLLGGDTSGSAGVLIVSITILGLTRDRPLTRSGARPGDGVYVSGPLGGSALGRRLLETGWGLSRDGRSAVATRSRLKLTPAERSRGAAALALHLDPAPRLALGRLLAAKRLASAAIDLSDGLSLDLARLADASGVGARLLTQALPIHLSARALAPRLGIDPLTLALHGGEDYELLFTVPASKERLLDALAARDPACRALFIGRVTSRRHGLTLEDPDGSSRRLPVAGYDHFKVE